MLGLLKDLDPSLDFSDTEKVQMLYFNLEKWLTCQTLLTVQLHFDRFREAENDNWPFFEISGNEILGKGLINFLLKNLATIFEIWSLE